MRKATERGDRDDREPDREHALVGDGGEVDREDQRADEHHGEDAAGVVDRLGGLVHVGRDEPHREREPDDR